LLILTLSATWHAEQLPIKTYTAADGLPRDRVYKVVADPRGFLWFCTNDGLSRFDGYEFTNYSTANGLPHRIINDLLITKDGDYWAATDSGIAHFNSLATTPETKFQAYPSPHQHPYEPVETLFEDRDGTIWAGTLTGLLRLVKDSGNWKLEYVSLGEKSGEHIEIRNIVEDTPGVLWIATKDGLYRRRNDGSVKRFTTQDGLPDNDIRVAYKDRDGSVWLATGRGLSHLAREVRDGQSIVTEFYTKKDGLIGELIYSIIRTTSGWLWVATSRGLSEFSPDPLPDGTRFINYTREHGFSDAGIRSIAEDRDGNLWLGTESGGAMKLTRRGFVTYSEKDGLETGRIAEINETRDGQLYVVTPSPNNPPGFYLHQFDGRRFQKVRLNLPSGIVPSWGWYQLFLQDRANEWWVPTQAGLYRFPPLKSLQDFATARPLKIYTPSDGLGGTEPFRLYEDTRGDLWISIITGAVKTFLNRWERATNSLHSYTSNDVSIATNSPTAFREDRSGNLWIGFYEGGIVRLRNGHFDVFTLKDGIPAGFIRAIHLDATGRLWIASSDGGVARVDDPNQEHPNFIIYSKKQGLSSDLITSVTEDQWGRIYFGTGIGVDRLDPATGLVKRYTTADGLANSYVNVSYRDRNGALWFGTLQGLSKLVLDTDKQIQPPPILIQSIRVAGTPLPVSELGVTQAGKFEFEAAQNQLEIKFLSLGFRPGEVLRYQFKLEGADNDWGAPTAQRTITYANLKPGNYRFLVRAVNADGSLSAEPAAVTFTIVPPVWQRWWFIALIVLLLAALTHLIYRYHTRRLIELERVRTRIATDLHDDIGASLSKIAILSELAGQEVAVADAPMTGSLGQIADTSRDALDAMSDIVWAVNPQRDRLSDLTQRMRRFAEDLLDARDIEFTFHAPVSEKDMRLGADLRREVYLIFKECVNNLVKHSDCTRAELDFRISGQWLVVWIADNGSGFVQADVTTNGGMGGHGLASMQRRAQALGGSLAIVSERGKGTRITLKVPVSQRQGWRAWFLHYPNGR
jgi:ligand-binding sensor domain-containing protein/signal transduction histidine kinase